MESAPSSRAASEADPAPPPGVINVAEPECAPAPSPPRSGRWTLWRGVRCGLLGSVPLGGLVVLDELFLVGFSMFLALLLVFGLLVTLLLGVFTAPLLLFRATTRDTLPIFGCAATFATVAIAALFLLNAARMVAFARVARDADPLVAALHDFTAREGHPPAALDELVPEYISQVPSASHQMGDFEYLRSDDGLTPTDVGSQEPLQIGPLVTALALWSRRAQLGRIRLLAH